MTRTRAPVTSSFFGEDAADERLDVEDGPEVRGDLACRNFFGLAVARQGGVAGFRCRDIGEHCVLPPPLGPFGGRGEEVVRVSLPHVVPDHHEPAGVGIGQRTNENGIDGAEHRRVGADAQRQSRDGDGRERRVPSHLSQSVPDVAPELVHEYADAHGHGVTSRLGRGNRGERLTGGFEGSAPGRRGRDDSIGSSGTTSAP